MSTKFLVLLQKDASKDDKYITMTIRIEKETQESFNQLAAQSHRSRNELIGMALKYALENLECE